MTLSLPPSYVPLPVELIEQAYAPDKPHRVLFASFVRLLALAWQNKYERTPKLREDELYNTKKPDGTTKFGYLKLSRREYFTQKREMQLAGWLRSSHPAIGFVQFLFSRAIEVDSNAQPRTEVRKTAQDSELMRIEDEESLKLKIKESSSSSSEEQVRKTAQVHEFLIVDGFMVTRETKAKMQLLLEHLHLIFAPEIFGVLDIREDLLTRDPEQTLGWIAKAFQDRDRLTQGGGPIGLIVINISKRRTPPRYYTEHYVDVLPEVYLEAIHEIQYECDHCSEAFGTRDDLTAHTREKHPFQCTDCDAWFMTAEEQTQHWMTTHYVYRERKPLPDIPTPELDGKIETIWQAVLSQLQLKMPRASFDTWVRDTRACRYDGNTLTISTRNAYAQDWLESRLTSTIERLLPDITKEPTKVCFVINSSRVEE